MNARWRGCSLSTVPSPSIVVIWPFATLETGATQERTGLPSTSTVHAPHCASPQPNLGPVSWRSLPSIQRGGVSGSTATVLPSPLTRSVKLAMPCPSDLHRPVRRDEDLAAALPALRVRQRGLDLVDGVHLLDRRRQDAL